MLSSSNSVLTCTGAKNLVVRLILALQDLPAAGILPSKNAVGVLLDDLDRFVPSIALGKFDVPKIVTLCERVIGNVSSTDIWSAVYDLVTESGATSPPTISNKVPIDTPLRSNSSSQQGSEQTHRDIDQRILQEIDGRAYNDTKGFYEKYFEGKPWSSTADQIVRAADPQIVNGLWTDYPNPPSQGAFLKWFGEFQRTFFQGQRGKFYTSHGSPLGGSECNRQPDVFLAHSRNAKGKGKYGWPDVQVIGELKETISRKYRDEHVKLCGHAREVFASQPTRLFIQGFIIRGSMVELWVFDRSGPYGSEKFDLHKDPGRFIKVIASYTMMSDEDLGLNTYIKESKYGRYVVFNGDDEVEGERLYLEGEPIAFQRAIVCRGTTCYRAKRLYVDDWEFVAKFSWRSDKRQAEGELLQLAKKREVWGVARLFGYQDLTSITNLRQGLQFGKPRCFQSTAGGLISQTQSTTKSGRPKNSRSKSTGLSIGGATLELSGQKRRQDGEGARLRRSKRSKSGSSHGHTDTITRINTVHDDGIEEACIASLVDLKDAGIGKASTTSLNQRGMDDASFDNRIFCCLVVSPPGRAIHEFKSVLEFLEACHDVIKGHRSLYEDGKILHRDISVNNIIITDAQKEGDPKGMLIDLDLAKELNSGSSGARHRTGTMEFMAIEVLKGTAHTYRHDLESFFYVFLWVVIRHGQKETLKYRRRKSRLQGWHTGTYDEISRNKLGDISAFEDIIVEFPPRFEGLTWLAEEMRDILFGTGRPFIGTYQHPEDINSIYDEMIDAFAEAIEAYRKSAG